MVSLLSRVRWRRVDRGELEEVVRRLEEWPAPAGGAVRHLFPLATIESRGASVVRVADDDQEWACCIVLTGHLMVPCGDGEVISQAGVPQRSWRLVVGDAIAADALLDEWRSDDRLIVHAQRFQHVDPDRVPSAEEVPDPGLRPAEPADVPGLTELAVQLHRADGYGPEPGRAGRRSYRRRMESSVQRGTVRCVGPVGDPLAKVEFAVSSDRYGTQLSGICVQEGRRGEGLGTQAVAGAVREALAERPGRPIVLHVRADNEPALRSYAQVGFVDLEDWRLAVRP